MNEKKIFEKDNVRYPNEHFYKVIFDPSGYLRLDGNGIRNGKCLSNQILITKLK